jgi:hypothetical protein
VITAVVARPGKGKGIILAKFAYEALLGARCVVADYPLVGALLCLTQLDLTSEPFRGAFFLFDELGSSLSSRMTLELPRAVHTAWSQHRKLDVDVAFACQHLGQVDVQMLRLTERFVFIRRIGPGGDLWFRWLARVAPGGRLPLWKRLLGFVFQPWFFVYSEYPHESMDEETRKMVPGAKRTSFLPKFIGPWAWRRFASMYDTHALVEPVGDRDLWHRVRAGAIRRRALPVCRRGADGMVQGPEVDESYFEGLEVPLPPGPKDRSQDLRVINGSAELRELLESRGYSIVGVA